MVYGGGCRDENCCIIGSTCPRLVLGMFATRSQIEAGGQHLSSRGPTATPTPRKAGKPSEIRGGNRAPPSVHQTRRSTACGWPPTTPIPSAKRSWAGGMTSAVGCPHAPVPWNLGGTRSLRDGPVLPVNPSPRCYRPSTWPALTSLSWPVSFRPWRGRPSMACSLVPPPLNGWTVDTDLHHLDGPHGDRGVTRPCPSAD